MEGIYASREFKLLNKESKRISVRRKESSKELLQLSTLNFIRIT